MKKLIKVQAGEFFTKLQKNLLNVKYTNCKKGRFSMTKKTILANLIQKYENFYQEEELLHKDREYHFYIQAKPFMEETGVSVNTITNTLKWLQEEGYLTYFVGNKKGYCYHAYHILMNIEYLNKILSGEINNTPTKVNKTVLSNSNDKVIQEFQKEIKVEENELEYEKTIIQQVDETPQDFQYNIKGETLLTTTLPTVEFTNDLKEDNNELEQSIQSEEIIDESLQEEEWRDVTDEELPTKELEYEIPLKANEIIPTIDENYDVTKLVDFNKMDSFTRECIMKWLDEKKYNITELNDFIQDKIETNKEIEERYKKEEEAKWNKLWNTPTEKDDEGEDFYEDYDDSEDDY